VGLPTRRATAPSYLIGVVLVVFLVAALSSDRTDSGSTAFAGGASVYWGAYVGGGQYGLVDAPWDMTSVDRFEAHAGKRMSLLEWAQRWYECSTTCGFRGFRSDLMSKARASGYLPVLSWGSYAAGRGEDQPGYGLSEIISGRYDSFIRRWATGAKRWGHPFFLRFDWEMNTNSVPYSEHSNGNGPGEFVRMWRHVHRIFTTVGAENVTWVWCPNVEYSASVKPLSSLYPGDAYVDWTCLDGYNWGTNPARPSAWMSFDEVFGDTYRLVTTEIAPSKPLMIGETASTEIGGSKARWIEDAFGAQGLDRFPRIEAIVWFNKYWSRMDWPIETSDAAKAALRAAIRSPAYADNRFRHAHHSPIPPLR
jgi:Glycosyl hydrolase family 26